MSIRTHIIKSTVLLSTLFIAGQIAEATTVEVGGSLRPRVEFVEGSNVPTDVNTNKVSKNYTTMQTRVNIKATVDENVSAFIQIQDVRTWGGEDFSNTGSTFPKAAPPSITRTGTANSGSVDFHQAYFVVKNAMNTGLNLKIGRQEIIFDEHRLIGNIGWIQQAQSFDAARVDSRSGNFGFTGFYAQTVSHDTHPTLSSTVNAANFGIAGSESEFGGARGTYYLGGKDRITAYYYGAFNPTHIPGFGAAQELHTTGLYAVKTFNGIRVRFDGAFQFGNLNATQDIDAQMMTFSIGRKLDIASGAHIAVWLDYLSGDSNGLTDNTRQTFTTPYATNHKFYGHVDKFLTIPAAGMIDAIIKFWIKPTPKIKLVAHAHSFTAPEAASGGDNLGSEIDLQLHYALAKNTKAVLGVSQYVAGDATTGGTAQDTTWGFLQFVSKF
jgi:hypothetical protein